MTAPGVGAADLAAYGLGGAGPVVDLADALAHGCFDGDDGGDAVELTADALEAKDERGDPIDAHAAAITALAGEASRVALNAVPLDDDEAVVDGDPEPPPRRRSRTASCAPRATSHVQPSAHDGRATGARWRPRARTSGTQWFRSGSPHLPSGRERLRPTTRTWGRLRPQCEVPMAMTGMATTPSPC